MFKNQTLVLAAVISAMVAMPFAQAKTTYTLADGEVVSDPTKPAYWRASGVKSRKTDFKLNYILSAQQRKQAIVNGKKVTVGDTVSGAKVVSISDAQVVLRVEGENMTLRVNKKRNDIKKTN